MEADSCDSGVSLTKSTSKSKKVDPACWDTLEKTSRKDIEKRDL